MATKRTRYERIPRGGSVAWDIERAGTLLVEDFLVGEDPPVVPPVPRIAVVQSVTQRGGGVLSYPLTLNGVKAGNALILCCNYVRDGTTAPTVVVSGGMSATLAAKADTIANNNGYGGKAQILYQLGVTAGTKVVTVTFTGDPYTTCTLMEVSGLMASGALDVTLTSGAGTGTAIATGTSAPTTQADELVVATMLQQSDNNATSIDVPSGYTLLSEEEEGSAYCAGSVCYKVVTETGTQSASWVSNRSAQWNAILATFKAAPTDLPPSNTSLPTLSGIRALGNTLTCDPGVWAGTPTLVFTYQWTKDGVDISGANASTFAIPSSGYSGSLVRCRVTATNASGEASATSAPLKVLDLPPPVVRQFVNVDLYKVTSGSHVLTLPSAVLEGSSLVLLVSDSQAATSAAPTLSGDVLAANHVTTSVGQSLSYQGQYPSKTRAYAKFAVTAGSKSVTLDYPVEHYGQATLAEVLNVTAVDVIQNTGVGVNGTPGTGSTISTGVSAATSTPVQIVFATMMQSTSMSEGTTVLTPPATYVDMGWIQTSQTPAMAYKVVDEVGAQEAVWSSNKYNAWTAILITLKGEALPGATGTVLCTVSAATPVSGRKGVSRAVATSAATTTPLQTRKGALRAVTAAHGHLTPLITAKGALRTLITAHTTATPASGSHGGIRNPVVAHVVGTPVVKAKGALRAAVTVAHNATAVVVKTTQRFRAAVTAAHSHAIVILRSSQKSNAITTVVTHTTPISKAKGALRSVVVGHTVATSIGTAAGVGGSFACPVSHTSPVSGRKGAARAATLPVSVATPAQGRKDALRAVTTPHTATTPSTGRKGALRAVLTSATVSPVILRTSGRIRASTVVLVSHSTAVAGAGAQQSSGAFVVNHTHFSSASGTKRTVSNIATSASHAPALQSIANKARAVPPISHTHAGAALGSKSAVRLAIAWGHGSAVFLTSRKGAAGSFTAVSYPVFSGDFAKGALTGVLVPHTVQATATGFPGETFSLVEVLEVTAQIELVYDVGCVIEPVLYATAAVSITEFVTVQIETSTVGP